MKKMLLISLFSYYFCAQAQEMHWNWQNINYHNLRFPAQFYWGIADSALQVEGIVGVNQKPIANSWTEFEKILVKTNVLSPHQRVGSACQRWQRYKEDIALIKSLHMTMYRFSIDWSKIEPQEGAFDRQAMQHYIDLIDELQAQGIEPMVTLFHHVYPLWFGNKGAFEKKANNYYFIRFAHYIFNHLQQKVRYWITFNEPIGYALEAYFRGNYPPGKTSFILAGKVAKNQLNAHVAIARLFKSLNNKVSIGISNIYNPIDFYNTWNPIERVVSSVFHYVVNDLIIDFFKKGTFNWTYMVRDHNKQAPGTLDFIGINYYTHTVLHQVHPFKIIPDARPEEKIIGIASAGRGQKVMYPEGLYRAIVAVNNLHIPIFITENGCACSNDQLTQEYIDKHLYVISKALHQGYPIKGYLYWTLTDCFCWRKGYREKHGIFALDFATQQRTFRPVYQCLVDVINKFSSQNNTRIN